MQNSDLISLVGMMRNVFSETPPVYAKVPEVHLPAGQPRNFSNARDSSMMSYASSSSPALPANTDTGNQPTVGWASGGSLAAPMQGLFPREPPRLDNRPVSPSPRSNASTLKPAPGNLPAPGTDELSIRRASCVSVITDRLVRQMRSCNEARCTRMDDLLTTQQKLKDRQMKIDRMLEAVAEEEKRVSRCAEQLRSKDEQLMAALRVMDEQVPRADELVTATAPLYAQLIELVAQDSAIDDCRFALLDALQKEKIDVTTFIKNVRQLSQQQFMARETIKRARRVANLPGK